MSESINMFVTSSGKDSEAGVYAFELNTASGEMSPAGEMADFSHAQFAARHPTRPVLYASGHVPDAHLMACRIHDDGSLESINRQPTHGREPCYVSVDATGKFAFVVNYTGEENVGDIRVFPLAEDGSVLPFTQSLRLEGSSVHPNRQTVSHPHMIVPTPDQSFVLVTDLGTDKVMIYRFDRDNAQLQAHTQLDIDIQVGSGPRHLAFHPTMPFFYVLSELKPVLTVVKYDTGAGTFGVVRTYPTLPEDAPEIPNHGADIHITQSGRFLYASNRGHDNLAIYAVDDTGVKLTPVGHQSTLGNTPRGFAIDPSDRIVVAANQDTHDVFTFHIDSESGQLTPTGYQVTVPGPNCIVFSQR